METKEFYVFQPRKPFGVLYMLHESKINRFFNTNIFFEETHIYFPKLFQGRQWFKPDLTPVLLEDVPKNYRAAALLIT